MIATGVAVVRLHERGNGYNLAHKTAMETRRGRYYYKKQWVGGTCQSTYIGQGGGAELLAQQEEEQRQARQAEREALRQQQAAEDAIDQGIDEIGDALGSLVDALMLVNGYHTHRRQWRKRRDRRNQTHDEENRRTNGSG